MRGFRAALDRAQTSDTVLVTGTLLPYYTLGLVWRQTTFEIASSTSARSDAHWGLMRQASEAKLKQETVPSLKAQLCRLADEAVAPSRRLH